MDKPSTLAYRDLIDDITNVINKSDLPPFVVIPVMKEILAQLVQLDEQQYKCDEAKYRAALQAESKKQEEQEG